MIIKKLFWKTINYIWKFFKSYKLFIKNYMSIVDIDLLFENDDEYIKNFYSNNKHNTKLHEKKYMAFCYLCGKGKLEMAKWLLNYYREINMKIFDDTISKYDYYNFMYRILEIVCYNEYTDVAEWLLSMNPKEYTCFTDHPTINSNNNSIFILLCRNGKINMIRWLFSKYNPQDFIRDRQIIGACNTCFIESLINGQLEVAKLLLSVESYENLVIIDPNYRISYNNTTTFFKVSRNSRRDYNLLNNILLTLCSNGNTEEAKLLVSLDNELTKGSCSLNIHSFNNEIIYRTFLNCEIETVKWMLTLDTLDSFKINTFGLKLIRNICYTSKCGRFNDINYDDRLYKNFKLSTLISGNGIWNEIPNIIIKDRNKEINYLLYLYWKGGYKINKRMYNEIKRNKIYDEQLFLLIDDENLNDKEKEIKYKMKKAINIIEKFLFFCYYRPNGIHCKKIIKSLS